MESKIVYKDGDKIRSVRGEIINEDDTFILLKRRTSEIRINKNIVLRIETRKEYIQPEVITQPEELSEEDRKNFG